MLGFTFGEGGDHTSHVTFSLTAIGDKVRMVITHQRLGDQSTVFSVARGWHTHVAILLDRLTGMPPRPFWTTHEMLDAQYSSLLARLE